MRVNHYYGVAVAAATAVSAASLKDVKHVVLFMQENRAFDHYYGTMAGVRGFADPNVPVDSAGLSTFQQAINPPQNGSQWLSPYYINYLGGEYINATQCMGAGGNDWISMHAAYADGSYNNWTTADTGFSMAYFTRKEIPTHFDIVEGFTVLDMNHQSILGPTDPNRCIWLSASVNVPGSPSNPHGDGGAMLDNTASPGCDIETPIKANCFPFTWKTFPEYLQEAGVSWQVYQDLDNFEDNPLAYFAQYQNAPNGSALREKGNSYLGLEAFYEAAGNGTLPQVSWIIGAQELSEHPPNRPADGAWLQQKVVEAVVNSPKYEETALIISYDEQGGWYDHVPPIVAPEGTPGEWLQDPYQEFGYVPLGPGPRVPRYIISPYTRGGNVFTETSDHNSDILFVEQWAAAQGYKGVYSKEMTQWRRDHMSNLVNAFDFDNPDYSKPYITPAEHPPTEPNNPSDYTGEIALLGSLTGPWAQPAMCLSEYSDPQAPVPWGPENSHQDLSLLVEEGFKQVRGQLSEGRFLVFESLKLALTNVDGKFVGVSPATAAHENIRQRWILHSVNDPLSMDTFYIQSALDMTYITSLGSLTSDMKDAQAYTISYTPNGATYSLSRSETGKSEKGKSFLSFGHGHGLSIAWEGAEAGKFKIFSVSYH
ncbi:non-hemolytic phospholipase C precursor [Penicillium lagena]|uniref:non-hemolytic phospholipase C precursor n=1 Tax=Penicillium lagena TaxID=94218 RepID=UPI0025411EC4|nr:non-hemolytic phospholipase C precursor [Penicillium lagena]KAJ5612182.1 non-hemolytic phospholipase C precursor [Penicillium lagena]